MFSASTHNCPHCGAELVRRTLELNGAPVFAGFEPCTCEGAMLERAEAEKAEAERQRREAELARRVAYEKAGIAPRFENASHPMAAGCAESARDGSNLYIYGNVGTGKTMLAAATSRILVDQGCRVRFTSMWRILDAIKKGFDEGYDPLPAYQRAEILVLDDFGKESPTDFALERIFALVDERYGRMLPTIITTQYERPDLGRRLAKNGDKDTAQAIVSRLLQDCRTIELTGGDRRLG